MCKKVEKVLDKMAGADREYPALRVVLGIRIAHGGIRIIGIRIARYRTHTFGYGVVGADKRERQLSLPFAW